MSYLTAEEECRKEENKARLADIRSEGEHQFITSLIEDEKPMWIGGSDFGTEKKWR